MASNVLRDITKYKRTRLVERSTDFEKRKTQLLDEAKQSNDPVETLLTGLEKIGFKSTTEPVSLANIRLMHKQYQFDASVPSTLIDEWEQDLKRLLHIKSAQYEYAGLFSQLATEWVDNPNEAKVLLNSNPAASTTTSDSEVSTEFEPVQVGRQEMHEQRQQWDSLVFTERHTDTAAIKRYLTELFAESEQKKHVGQTPLETIRESMKEFASFEEGTPLPCTEADVTMCIKAVLKQDLLSDSKRDELIGLRDARPAVRKEVADVINMEIANLEDWKWRPLPIPARMRRQLNGKYRVYMDPEVHQALLVQWIGVHFAVSVKTTFKTFFRTSAWPKSARKSMTAQDRVRMEYYLGDQTGTFSKSVLFSRRETYEDNFFMTHLPSSVSEGTRGYHGDGSDDEDYEDYEDYEDDDGDVQGKSPMEVKQDLLRLATTELVLQKKLYGSFSMVQTDFTWFGPSLPHNTIFTVLRFLGVEEIWLDWFQKFLSMSLVFPQDGPNAEARTRRCGVPISNILSDAFGEVILVCLDFAVSKATQGRCSLYRFHDDVWLWGEMEDCEIAWSTIKTFTDVMGLALNEEKTGSIHVSDSLEKPSSTVLPKGSVRWGFLVLDAAQARWVVDMVSIDEHILEMRRQFAQCQSVFSWVQAWNSYVGRFLRNNFGHPATCLGTKHLDMIFATFKYIQEKLFMDDDDNKNNNNNSGSAKKDVTSYLKSTITERFGTKDVVSAFLYWPVEFGGLGLRNPFIPLMTVRNDLEDDPFVYIDDAVAKDEASYELAKEKFESKKSKLGSEFRTVEAPEGCDGNIFFSFEEYTAFREETSSSLRSYYKALLKSPDEDGVESTRICKMALQSIPHSLQHYKLGSKAFNPCWSHMDTYWQWILQLYASESLEKFGGLMLGDEKMLPVELVHLMTSERIRWQG